MSGPLLVVGAEGLLGSALGAWGRQAGFVVHETVQHRDHQAAGIHRLELAEPLDAWSPPPCSSAVLCAAITSLEACRRDPEGTRQINVSQTVRLADKLVRAGMFVVFISSNLVFDGTRPCRPAGDPVCPRTEYGRQKAEVERALAAFGDAVAVVRLTKVVGQGWTLVRGWREAWRAGRAIEAFEDLVCAPLPLEIAVRGLLAVAGRRLPGVWQFSAARDVSYLEIARHLAGRLGLSPGLVGGVPTRARLSIEHLPDHTTLDTSRAVQDLDLCFPPPLEAVENQIFGT